MVGAGVFANEDFLGTGVFANETCANGFTAVGGGIVVAGLDAKFTLAKAFEPALGAAEFTGFVAKGVVVNVFGVAAGAPAEGALIVFCFFHLLLCQGNSEIMCESLLYRIEISICSIDLINQFK